MKTNKVSFKTVQPTGRYKSFESPMYLILSNKKRVGAFEIRNIGTGKQEFKIRLTVLKTDTINDGNPNCDWQWITLNKTCYSLEEAQEFCNAHFTTLTSKYQLKQLDV